MYASPPPRTYLDRCSDTPNCAFCRGETRNFDKRTISPGRKAIWEAMWAPAQGTYLDLPCGLCRLVVGSFSGLGNLKIVGFMGKHSMEPTCSWFFGLDLRPLPPHTPGLHFEVLSLPKLCVSCGLCVVGYVGWVRAVCVWVGCVGCCRSA